MTPTQTQYIHQLIDRFNQETNPLFDQQLRDMTRLVCFIREDRLDHDQYGVPEINMSFQKFFYQKGLMLTMASQKGGGYPIHQIYEDLKRSRLNYFQ